MCRELSDHSVLNKGGTHGPARRRTQQSWRLRGNGDVHAKIVSILATPAGEWRVSPAYDLPSTLPYRDHTLALSMLGSHDGLSRKLLLAFADATGVPARAAERTLAGVLAATQSIPVDILPGVNGRDSNCYAT
jgi:serine/threonine protein kinase HipA of HipAB toxin-antitoxin module